MELTAPQGTLKPAREQGQGASDQLLDKEATQGFVCDNNIFFQYFIQILLIQNLSNGLSLPTFVFVVCADLVFALFCLVASGKKLSSEDAVKRVLSGEKVDVRGRASRTSKSHEPDNKNAREEDSRAHKDREVNCKLHIFKDETVFLKTCIIYIYICF